MSSKVVTVETNFVAQPTSAQALAANASRAYLQIQNASDTQINYKFGSDFKAPSSTVQKVAFSRVPDGGTWVLGGSAPMAYNANAAAVQTALQAVPGIGAGNALVTGDYTVGFTVTFAGALANMVVPVLALTSSLTDSTADVNAVQAINFDTPPTAGQFVLSFKGESTAALDFDISTANLQAALNILGNVNGGVNLVAQDGTTKDFSVTMGGTFLAAAAQPLLVLVSSTLTGSANLATQTQVLYAAPAPIAGSFTLSNGTHTTAALAFDAVAADIQAALEALASIGAGNITVAGSDIVSGFTVTFAGTLVHLAVAPLFVASNTLEANGLDEDDTLDAADSGPDDCAMSFPTTVTGHGTDTVHVTFATTVAGGGPAASTSSVSIQTVGDPGDLGVPILALGGALFDAECPIDSVWIKADSGPAQVTLLEG